ncbi:MAG: T9SS type A sorting domain-containing protein [Chitinophagaceae bacterium]
MKKILPLIFCSLIFFSSQAQIVASDAGGCIQIEDEWAPAGMVGARNTYLSILANGVFPCRVIWDATNLQWIIEADVDSDTFFETLLYVNTLGTTPNPPSLGTGTWEDMETGCGPLVQFSGPYTQNFVVPVTLVSFTAELLSAGVTLNWTTASEFQNKHFLVERSNDGAVYSTIGTVTSQAFNGSGSEKLDYTFGDNHPVSGLNYYRLKQVDIDGHFEYSDVVTISFVSLSRISFYPNPVKDKLFIRGTVTGSLNYTILNAGGQTVIKGSTLVSNPIDLSSLQKGLYYLKTDHGVFRLLKD